MGDLVSRKMNPEKLETLRRGFDAVGEEAAVLGVGGFLGVGEKDMAIDWFLVVNSSKEMFTNAPAYVSNAKS